MGALEGRVSADLPGKVMQGIPGGGGGWGVGEESRAAGGGRP